MKINGREIVFWGCDKFAERLYFAEKDEAIEAGLEGSNQWDGMLTVYGWARMVISSVPAEEMMIEWLLEYWEEYIDPENEPDVTEGMCTAAKEFIAVMVKEFKSWSCEIIHSEEIDAAGWIAEKRPMWQQDRKKP